MGPIVAVNLLVGTGYLKGRLVIALMGFSLPLKVTDPSDFLSTDLIETLVMLDKIGACPNKAPLSAGFILSEMADVAELMRNLYPYLISMKSSYWAISTCM